MATEETERNTTEKTVDLMAKLKAPMTITAPTWAYTAAGFFVLLLLLAALD